ncbi:MAG TPA: TonB family protein [Vicinamibacteria bacterium]|nr:TonB family protein [Vicinamibacteria bacterium]
MVGSMRVNGAGPVVEQHEMFAGLSLRARPGRACAAPASLLAHAVGLTLLIVLSLTRGRPPGVSEDRAFVPIYGAPVALPPLPRGNPGSARTQRTRPPEPAVFTAPVETTTTEPIVDPAGAPAEDLAPSTGSPLGADDGTVDGSDAGKAGGRTGGVPWGVPGGRVDGTGDLPLPVANPDQPPRLLHRVQPEYPQQAFTQKVEGTVTVEILIDAAGKVRRPRVIHSIPQLDEAVVAAVRQWVFAPAMKDGRPVATLALVPMKFQIY